MITKDMQIRIAAKVAENPTKNPHIIREELQEMFNKEALYTTNTELYEAILSTITPPTVEQLAQQRERDLSNVVKSYEDGLQAIVDKYELPVEVRFVEGEKLSAIKLAIADKRKEELIEKPIEDEKVIETIVDPIDSDLGRVIGK